MEVMYRKDRLKNRSFCLCQYVQNGLSYPGKETRPMLCLKGRQANFGVSSLGTNKDQPIFIFAYQEFFRFVL